MNNFTPVHYTSKPTVRCTRCKNRFEYGEFVVMSDKLDNKFFCDEVCLYNYIKPAKLKLKRMGSKNVITI